MIATPDPVDSTMYRFAVALPFTLRTVIPAFAATSTNQAGVGCSALAGIRLHRLPHHQQPSKPHPSIRAHKHTHHFTAGFAAPIPAAIVFNTFPPSSTTYSLFTARSFNVSFTPEGQTISTASTFVALVQPKVHPQIILRVVASTTPQLINLHHRLLHTPRYRLRGRRRRHGHARANPGAVTLLPPPVAA